VKLQRFLESWRGVQWENRVWRIVALGLIMTNLITAGTLALTERTVVLVPPVLDAEAAIGRTRASAELKTGWGLYLAQLLGNVTPANAEFLKTAVAPILDASIYREVMAAIGVQVNELKLDRVALSYEPKEIAYEAQTDKVFVTGTQTSAGPVGQPQKRVRTYEFRFVVRNYRPYLVHIDAYPGTPVTVGSPAAAQRQALEAQAGNASRDAQEVDG